MTPIALVVAVVLVAGACSSEETPFETCATTLRALGLPWTRASSVPSAATTTKSPATTRRTFFGLPLTWAPPVTVNGVFTAYGPGEILTKKPS